MQLVSQGARWATAASRCLSDLGCSDRVVTSATAIRQRRCSLESVSSKRELRASSFSDFGRVVIHKVVFWMGPVVHFELNRRSKPCGMLTALCGSRRSATGFQEFPERSCGWCIGDGMTSELEPLLVNDADNITF